MKNAATIELENEAYFKGRFPFGDCFYYFDQNKQEIGYSFLGWGIKTKREWRAPLINEINLTQLKFT